MNEAQPAVQRKPPLKYLECRQGVVFQQGILKQNKNNHIHHGEMDLVVEESGVTTALVLRMKTSSLSP